MKQRDLKDWNDITFNEFLKLKEIAENTGLTEDMQMLEMVMLLFGDVPVSDLYKYVDKITNVISQPMPTGDTIESTVEVNGHKYTVTKDLSKITTSQFIDYSNYCKNKAELIDMLTCFIIPEGHKYDDGYDMLKVRKDFENLSVITVQKYCFFFRKAYLKSQKISLFSLIMQTLMLKGMPWKNKLKMASAQATLLTNMDYLTTYLQSSRKVD